MSSSKYLAKAFTLVELIVVISVLAILATIAFTQISNVTLSARNSTRMTNLQSISSSLNLYIATNGVYPIPDNKTDILYSGSVIGYQGYIKDTAARILKLSPTASQDPLNTSSYFSYATNASRTDAQILGFLEANTTSFKAIPTTFASDELSTKTPYSKGEELGMLYTSGTTTPLSGTGLDVSTTTSAYTAYYNSTDSLSGTGNLLQNLLISYSYGAGYGSPATDSCPTGFIPVPGNKDFNQPGFCVMKYEAKALNGSVGDYNGHTGSVNDTIVSNATDYPITYVSQPQAIAFCQSIGTHLVTNNEAMTMARNIEQVPSNWSDEVVGSGYVYSGHNDGYPNNFLVASTDDNNGYIGTGDSSASPGDGVYTNFASNLAQAYKGQKRTLSFSNGQIIWDLAGNVWEHVNKANTLNGNNFNAANIGIEAACNNGSWNWWSWYGNDGRAECGFINGYSRLLYGPLGAYNANNGMGRVYATNVEDRTNITLRGGDASRGAHAGIYMLDLSPTAGFGVNVGFRCAK